MKTNTTTMQPAISPGFWRPIAVSVTKKILLLLAIFLLPALARANAPQNGRPPLPHPDFLVTLVQRELAVAPVDAVALAAIYRHQVRSFDEAATFFYSATFLRLDLAGQRRVIDDALTLDPIRFLPQTGLLPLSLREEYRERARAAAQAQVLRRLAGLKLQEEAALYLPSHEGMRATAAGEEAFDRPAQVRRFLHDPALRQLAAIENSWVAAAAGPFVSAAALIEAKVIAARNLDRRGLAANRQNVAAVFAELAAARRELGALPIFQGRVVVMAAGKNSDAEGPTFGKDSTLAAIAAQGATSVLRLRSGEAAANAQLARLIADTAELTLVLETHGRPDALEFSGALSPRQLATLFAARQAKGPAIVIVNACFAHDFARAFAAELGRRGSAVALVIVPEEFGQATLIGRQENSFTRDELGLGRQGVSTVAQLWLGVHRETAVYAPLDGGFAQIR